MQRRTHPSRPFGALLRALALSAVVVTAGAVTLATGTGGASPARTRAPQYKAASSSSCAGVSGAHHADLVVEASAKTVVRRCVGFSGRKIPALKLLEKSHLQIGTQKFSFGVAICQVDHVPSHYSKCLPTGQPYWALFLSTNGRRWTSPSTGVSEVSVPAGGSLGLRYDSPTGTPAPPPHPTPA